MKVFVTRPILPIFHPRSLIEIEKSRILDFVIPTGSGNKIGTEAL